jgi:hypothetical protein
MCDFNVGDIVRLTNVTEDDKLHGRYIGEIGIFQKLYNYKMRNEEDSAEIRFGNTKGYVVYLEDLELVATANIRSIFLAHDVEHNKELLKDVQQCVERMV